MYSYKITVKNNPIVLNSWDNLFIIQTKGGEKRNPTGGYY